MKKLFEQTKINDIELKNRFARSGTWICKATEDGELTEELFAYYEKLAKANLGMVTVGYSRVMEDERANNGMIGMWDDKFIENLKKLTDMFHDNNTPVGIQIAMGGTQVHYQGDIKWKLYSPGKQEIKRKDEYGNEMTYHVDEMTKAEIDFVIEKFASAARRVKEAGFDMVQIHAGHGYFVSQWLNPEINNRTDEYGQDKTKFIVELYEAVRKQVGADFTVGIKINSEEKINDHSNYSLMLDLCQKLDERKINFIEVSGFAPSRTKVKLENESYFAPFAKELTKVVNCQTILTGGNKTFSNIEKVLNETGVDIIGLSRTLVSEPSLVKTWQENPEYKSRCVSCNHCHRVTNVCVFDIKR